MCVDQRVSYSDDDSSTLTILGQRPLETINRNLRTGAAYAEVALQNKGLVLVEMIRGKAPTMWIER